MVGCLPDLPKLGLGLRVRVSVNRGFGESGLNRWSSYM